MRGIAIVCALITLLSGVGGANAEYIVRGAAAKGGDVAWFFSQITRLRNDRVKAALTDECVSSCTLFTSLLREGLLCAYPGTKLVFHRFFYSKNVQLDAQGNIKSFDVRNYVVGNLASNLWLTYPASIRSVILRYSPAGLPPVGNELKISARELGIPAC